MLTLRPLTSEDEPFLRALIGEIVTDELGAHCWPDAMRGPLLDIQYRARLQGLRATFPQASERIVMFDAAAIGWIVIAREPDAIHLADIAILRSHRRRGWASELIRDLQADAARAGLPLRLHVVRQNPALRLYQRLGFEIDGGDDIRYSMRWSTPYPTSTTTSVTSS